jgi:FAD:protein FMN transferase
VLAHRSGLDRARTTTARDVVTAGPPPRSARVGLLSVTVIGPDLAQADAYATAAFAMGIDAGPAWTAELEAYDALCITDDGRMLSTPGFARHRAD